MIFEEYVKENRKEFTDKVYKISTELGIEANWLMFVMWFESRLNPQAVNPISNSVGLIQFMPSTARSMGTTTSVLKAMDNVQQLDYVLSYLRPYKGKMKRWVDVYLAVFYPAAMGKSHFVITPDIVAKQNKIFDINKDLDISVKEIETVLRNQIPERYKKYFA
ncbi:transglycosylase SLT domain-containing protein [Petrimonas sulfuriphila]|uniref:lytic transglycosylase domain-containing protein n=1 Tax=Petrimonas sulfuriphila TaxID=285070 RepID=UPI003EB8538B